MSLELPIYDAHNHLQDARLAPQLESIIGELKALPVRKIVVNGTRPEDWATVADLARRFDWIIPSYGLHPWFVNQICENWRELLAGYVRVGKAGIGEVGLDRWIADYDSTRQEDAFIHQLRLAAELDRPVTIHCLKAWGRLLEILHEEKLACGFLLHSYGGPAEMIPKFVELGGYFSLSGYFSHARKERQREVFRTVPCDRLLIETDAPDMALPPERISYKLAGESGSELNHPANIRAVYGFAAELYNLTLEELSSIVETNFQAFFRKIIT
jgi:TatD DNase family protein